MDHGAIAQQASDRFGGECRTHHDDSQIGTQRLADSHGEAEDEVHLDRPLVELVDDDGADVFDRNIFDETPQQNSSRHHGEARVAAHARIKADLIADFFAELAAAKLCDSSRHGTCGQTPGLDEDHFLIGRQVIQDGCWHEHGLARPRRRRDDDRATARGRDGVFEHAGHGQIEGQVVIHQAVTRRIEGDTTGRRDGTARLDRPATLRRGRTRRQAARLP